MIFRTAAARLLPIFIALGCSFEPIDTSLQFNFDPAVVPVVDWQRTPFPSDLYRSVPSLRYPAGLELIARADAQVIERDRLLPAMKVVGYGTQQAAYFGMQAPTEFWDSERKAASFAAQAVSSIALVNLDDRNAPDIPVEIHVDVRSRLLYVASQLRSPLRGGTQYAIVINAAILQPTIKREVGRSYAQILRNAVDDGVVESDYQDSFQQAIDRLEWAADDIAIATIFTTGLPTADSDAIVEQIYDGDPAVLRFDGPSYSDSISGASPLYSLFGTNQSGYLGHDRGDGVMHGAITAAYTGHISLTTWGQALNQQDFQRTASGLYPRATDNGEFVLLRPACDTPSGGYPVVIAQHGLGDNKEFVMRVGEGLSRECLVVIGIDAVAHGSRSRKQGDDTDRERNIGGTDDLQQPDGLHDGYPLAAVDQLYLPQPLAARANFLDTAHGLVQLEHLLASTDQLDTPHGPLAINRDQIGFVGQSMGGITGSLFTAQARNISTSVINVGGGNFLRIFTESPEIEKVGFAVGAIFSGDPRNDFDRFDPVGALLQGVMDGADPVNYAHRFLQSPASNSESKNVLMQAAQWDQLIPNSSTAALAKAAGIPLVGKLNPRTILFQESPHTLPVRSNVTANGQTLTAGFAVFPDADHNFIGGRCTEIPHTYDPPYDPLPEPYALSNPTESAQKQAAAFLKTGLTGIAVVQDYVGGVPNPNDCDGLVVETATAPSLSRD